DVQTIVAYYYYYSTGNLYKRCHPIRTVCDNLSPILMPNPIWQYGLFVSRELDTYVGSQFCWGAGTKQVTDCSQADPKPGKGPPFANKSLPGNNKKVIMAN